MSEQEDSWGGVGAYQAGAAGPVGPKGCARNSKPAREQEADKGLGHVVENASPLSCKGQITEPAPISAACPKENWHPPSIQIPLGTAGTHPPQATCHETGQQPPSKTTMSTVLCGAASPAWPVIHMGSLLSPPHQVCIRQSPAR